MTDTYQAMAAQMTPAAGAVAAPAPATNGPAVIVRPAPVAAPAASQDDLQAMARALYVQAKPLLKSRTLWSLIVVAVALVAKQFGHQFSDEAQSEVIDLIMNVVSGGGLTAAALFRVVASKPLT